MWYIDGISFVLNIVLLDCVEYEGGNFLFYELMVEMFDCYDWVC